MLISRQVPSSFSVVQLFISKELLILLLCNRIVLFTILCCNENSICLYSVFICIV
jgi:hypothetical protein